MPAACVRYVNAANLCISQYGLTADVNVPEVQLSPDWCYEEYAGAEDQSTADYFDCLARAYMSEDCVTYAPVGLDSAWDCVPLPPDTGD